MVRNAWVGKMVRKYTKDKGRQSYKDSGCKKSRNTIKVVVVISKIAHVARHFHQPGNTKVNDQPTPDAAGIIDHGA